jgi:hypothetical protein
MGATMLRRLRISLILPALAGAVVFSPAQAEIVGWVDASGRTTYSNLPPPAGVRVTDVIKEAPPPARTPAQAADEESQAQVRTLTERVRQLEWQVEQARRDASPPVVYQSAAYPPPPRTACDPDTFDCDLSWGPVFYVGGVVPRSHREHHFEPFRGKHHFAPPPPTRLVTTSAPRR